MKREEISGGTTDASKRAIMRREGCGYYNEESIYKTTDSMYTERVTQNITSFVCKSSRSEKSGI